MLFCSSELHPTTHLLMNQAEERRGERQTFELGAEEVRNRKGYACTVYRKTEKKGRHERNRKGEEKWTSSVERSGKLYLLKSGDG